VNIGIGYLFGARDDGLKRSINTIRNGIMGTESAIASANKAARSFSRGFADALQNIQLGHLGSQLDDIKHNLQGVTGSGLDTRLEQMSASFAQGFGAKGVMSGLEDVKREAFAVAFALNRDATAVADTALAFRKMGVEAYSIREMQQIVEATTLSGEQFAGVFQDLSKSWGLGEDGTKAFLDRFTDLNVQLGQGQEAFANLPGVMQAIGKGFAHLDLRPEDIQETVLSVSRLGAALSKSLGVSVDAAQQQSVEMFSALAAEGDAFNKMLSGMDGGLGQLTTELAQLGGGLEESLSIMKEGAKDPAKFMLGLTKTIGGLTESTDPAARVIKDRLLRSLEEINPSFAYLAKATGESADAFNRVMLVAADTGKTLTGVAKAGFHTGLTLEESIDKARMSMEQAFGGASRADRVAFANMMIKSYGLVGDTVRNLTGDSENFAKSWREQAAGMGLSAQQADRLRGVLGPVVEYLALFASAGVHGVLVKAFGPDSILAGAFGVLASGIGQLMPALLPLIAIAPAIKGVIAPAFAMVGTTMSAVVAPIASVAAPLLAVGAAIGVLTLAATGKLPAALNAVKSGVSDAASFVAKMGTQLLSGIGDALSSMDGADLAKSAISFAKTAASELYAALSGELSVSPGAKTAAAGLFDALLYAVSGAVRVGREFASTIYSEAMHQLRQVDWSGLLSSSMSSFADVDWTGLFGGLRGSLLSARHSIASSIRDMLESATAALVGMDFMAAGESVGSALASGLLASGPALSSVGRAISALFSETMAVALSPQFWLDTASAAWSTLKLAVVATFKVGELLAGVFLSAREGVGSAVGGMFDIKALRSVASGLFGDLRHLLASALDDALVSATSAVGKLDWGSIGVVAGEAMFSGMVLSLKAVAGLGRLIFDGIATVSKQQSAIGVLVMDVIAGVFKVVLSERFWKDSFAVVWSGFKLALAAHAGVTNFIFGVFAGMGKAAASAMFGPGVFDSGIAKVKDMVNSLLESFNALWSGIRAGAEALFGNSINTFVSHDFGKIYEILEEAKTWFGLFREVASSVFMGLAAPFAAFIKRFTAAGEVLTALSEYFGYSPAKVAELTTETKPPSGASTAAAAAQVSRAGDSYLAQVIVEQHTKDRAVLDSILKRLSQPTQDKPAATVLAPARPTSTGR
jgi:hypothetical protein